jgi:ribosomal protein S18 acetylase RimI-like enzyme
LTTVTIRPARAEDDAQLLEIDFATWTSTVSPAPPPTRSERPTFFREGRGPSTFLVAELSGVPCGFVSLRHASPLASHAHVMEINGLAVDPAAQGNGVGRHLVEHAVAEARRRGATKVTLRVLGPNKGAQRLYTRCGFVVEGVLKGEFVLDGTAVDDLLMARYL